MMKRMISGMMIAGIIASGLAGCVGKEQKRAADMQPEGELSRKPVTEVVYSSAVAAGKPAFAEDESRIGPLSMLDGRKGFLDPILDQVEIADIGAYESNGRRQCLLNIRNNGSDTLFFASVQLPDDRFKIEQPMDKFPPEWIKGIVLYGDEKEYIEDYKIVIVYKNEGIAPQTLHVNIHPDIHKLHADYAASQAE